MPAIDYLPGARHDFDEAIQWYAARSEEAACRFLTAIDSAIDSVIATPERFVLVDDVYRACPVERFPFRIIYRLVQDRILIVAIAHAKRRPGFWKNRE